MPQKETMNQLLKVYSYIPNGNISALMYMMLYHRIELAFTS